MDGIREELKQQPDEQLSLTDPDARSMVSQAKGTGVVGYNVQAVVEAKHHLIVTHEVTNVGSDRAQLTKMGTAAQEAMGKQRLQAVADRGYFSGPEIKACTEANITPMVPKPMTSNAKAEGRFSKADFIYIAKDDQYSARPGSVPVPLHDGRARHDHPQVLDLSMPALPAIDMHNQQLSAHHPMGARGGSEAMQRRLDRKPETMTLRRRTIEHVFGTLKHWMGSTHFLTRGLQHVGTEMSLQVLAYNLKRVIKLLGMAQTMKAMRLLAA